ncbi:MAG: hypothetical protein HY744_15460 [Deltaproteobacteria bacterium]|nr:hypothetical protein [Deltaproteobacteria bacterium]
MSDARRPRRIEPPNAEDRQALLAEGARAAGKQWAQRWRETLRQDGRRVVGGWPGTLSEARARAHAHFCAALLRAGMAELTSSELDRAARATYACARDDWLSRDKHEDPRDG